MAYSETNTLSACCLGGVHGLSGALDDLKAKRIKLATEMKKNLEYRKKIAQGLRDTLSKIPFIGKGLAAQVPDDLLKMSQGIIRYIPGGIGDQINQLIAEALRIDKELKKIESAIATAVDPRSFLNLHEASYWDDHKLIDLKVDKPWIPGQIDPTKNKVIESTYVAPAGRKKFKMPKWGWGVLGLIGLGGTAAAIRYG